MRKVRQTNGIGVLYFEAFLLVAIVSLVVWSEYSSNHTMAWIILSAAGFLFWLIEFVFIGRGAPADPCAQSRIGSSSESCFAKFYLNGYFFQPYEQQTLGGGKQFRLLATPQMSPEREAAIIRYLITEGLTEKMWPRMNRRIEEEANWAFFA